MECSRKSNPFASCRRAELRAEGFSRGAHKESAKESAAVINLDAYSERLVLAVAGIAIAMLSVITIVTKL